jgi:hypothetical protein
MRHPTRGELAGWIALIQSGVAIKRNIALSPPPGDWEPGMADGMLRDANRLERLIFWLEHLHRWRSLRTTVSHAARAEASLRIEASLAAAGAPSCARSLREASHALKSLEAAIAEANSKMIAAARAELTDAE